MTKSGAIASPSWRRPARSPIAGPRPDGAGISEIVARPTAQA
ncbi:hypothetical protein ACFXPQ_26965 [Streptomyces lydicus]